MRLSGKHTAFIYRQVVTSQNEKSSLLASGGCFGAVGSRGRRGFAPEALRLVRQRTVAPGERAAIDVALEMPSVASAQKLTLAATVRGTAPLAVRPVELVVRPQPSGRDVPAVALYDAKGLTAAKLKNLGVAFRRVKSARDVRDGVLVVGAESLDGAFAAIAKDADLARRVGEGRVTVVVMAQRPEALATLGLRTTPVYARTLFDAEGRAFSHWAGKGMLAPEKPEPDPKDEKYIPKTFFHWNNQNIVASYPILRTSDTPYAAWLVCGKDLVYAAVLAVPSGRGQVIFCQAEIESRSKPDVQADELMVCLLRKASEGALRPPSGAATVVEAAKASDYGVAAKTAKVDALFVAMSGKRVFASFSARDFFLRHPVEMTVFSGEGVEPLLEPAVVAKKTVDGKPVYFMGVAPEEKETADASTSVAWANEILENRLRRICAQVEFVAGAESSNELAERLEKPLSSAAAKGPFAWPYRHSPSTYETERHIRW